MANPDNRLIITDCQQPISIRSGTPQSQSWLAGLLKRKWSAGRHTVAASPHLFMCSGERLRLIINTYCILELFQ